MTINKKVLIVDDEMNLLRSLQRNLRKLYDVTIAEGGMAGLNQILGGGPYAVIVSGLQMPEVDGIQVLEMARIVTPDSVRVMLTGNVKVDIARYGSETNAWFRYVSQPCTTEQLCQILNEAINEHEMSISTKHLRSMGLNQDSPKHQNAQRRESPEKRNKALGRSQRLVQLSRRLGRSMNLSETWRYELAGMLSQISQIVSFDSATFENEDDQRESYLKRQAETSSGIIRRIPRMEVIADMVGLQYTDDFPANVAEFVRRGSRIVRMLTDYDMLIETMSPTEAICLMKARSTAYGTELFWKFSELISSDNSCSSACRSDVAMPLHS